MKFTPIDPPRRFEVSGGGLKLMLADCGRLALAPDEQVTFTTEAGAEYDVVRKDWGFYATPSTNGRLRGFGLRAALVLSAFDRLFVVLVEKGKEEAFMSYVTADKQRVLCWLDEDDAVARLAAFYGAKP
jgi:hypothetical protein